MVVPFLLWKVFCIMGNLSPVQLLTWIVLLELVSVPIIAYLATWIINVYFTKKEAKDLNLIKIVSESFLAALKEELEKKERENKNA